MKNNTKLIIAGGVGLALLLFGSQNGLLGGGGTEGGGTKKASVYVSPIGGWDESSSAAAPVSIDQPVPSVPTLPSFAEYLGTVLGLIDVKTYLQGDIVKYSGTRTATETGGFAGTYGEKYIEGTFRPDLLGQMQTNPQTGQLFTTNTGSTVPTPGVVLYTEKSREPVTKKEIASSATTAGSGQLWGNQGGYGGIAAVTGGAAGASGSRPGGTGSWTSAGYTTRY